MEKTIKSDVCSGRNLPWEQSHVQNRYENTRTKGAKYVQGLS